MGNTMLQCLKVKQVDQKHSTIEDSSGLDLMDYYLSGVPKGSYIVPGMQCPYFSSEGCINGIKQQVTKSMYRDRYLVILFHPAAHLDHSTLLCFTERFEEFKQEGCAILAVSCKTEANHLSWIRSPYEVGGIGDTKIHFLFDSGGQVCNQFGTLRLLREETWQSRRKKLQLEGENVGDLIEEHEDTELDIVSMRAVVIVDDNGYIKHTSFFGDSISPNVEDILTLVKAFKHVEVFKGDLCPALWNKGEDGIPDTIPSDPIWSSFIETLKDEHYSEIMRET